MCVLGRGLYSKILDSKILEVFYKSEYSLENTRKKLYETRLVLEGQISSINEYTRVYSGNTRKYSNQFKLDVDPTRPNSKVKEAASTRLENTRNSEYSDRVTRVTSLKSPP